MRRGVIVACRARVACKYLRHRERVRHQRFRVHVRQHIHESCPRHTDTLYHCTLVSAIRFSTAARACDERHSFLTYAHVCTWCAAMNKHQISAALCKHDVRLAFRCKRPRPVKRRLISCTMFFNEHVYLTNQFTIVVQKFGAENTHTLYNDDVVVHGIPWQHGFNFVVGATQCPRHCRVATYRRGIGATAHHVLRGRQRWRRRT